MHNRPPQRGEGFCVRPVRPDDADGIQALLRAAFPTDAEAGLVEAIEADRDAALSLVADDGGLVVGHVLFSWMTVVTDSRPRPAVGLAPVATSPAHQRTGIASLLIRTGLERLRDQGAAICFVLGDPAYYERFGFRAETAAPFDSPYAGPHFMALFLDSGPERPESGRADYAAAFGRFEEQ